MADGPPAAPPTYPTAPPPWPSASVRAALALALAAIALAAGLALRALPPPQDAALPLRGATDARTGAEAAPPR